MNISPKSNMSDFQFPKTADEFIDLFSRRKRLFFIPFFSVCALVLVLYPWLPRYYKSVAYIQVGQEMVSNPLEKDGRSSFDLTNKIKTLQVQFISWPNMVDLLKKMGVANDQTSDREFSSLIRHVRGNLSLEIATENVMTVTFLERSPEAAEHYANAIANDLVENSREQKQDEARNAIRFIQDQLRIYKGELDFSETRFIANQTRAELNDLVRQRELIERSLERNPVVSKLRAELVESELQLNRLLVTAKESHPMVQDLRFKIANLRKRITRESPNEDNSESPGEMSGEGLQYRDELLKKAKELDMKISALKERTGSSEPRTGSGLSGQELRNIERNQRVNEDIYKSLLQRLENAHIDHRLSQLAQSSDFRIIEPARVPSRPSSPDPWKTGIAAFLLAVLAGTISVFISEFLDRSIHGIKDAKSHIDLPYMGYIPKFFPKLKKHGLAFATNGKNDPYSFNVKEGHGVAPELVVFHDPESQAAEHFRLLRTTLFNQTRVRPLKSLLVTSSLKGEGKSTTAVNLATSIAADTNMRVIIIDADLRAGRLSSAVGVPSEPGLSEYLQGTAQIENIIKNVQPLGISVIPSGKLLLNPTKLFHRDRLATLLQALRSRFDFVILDTPPVLGISDVPTLSYLVDGILFVVQVGKPWRQDIQTASAVLQDSEKHNLVGYVLTHVENTSPAYRGSYMYGSYK